MKTTGWSLGGMGSAFGDNIRAANSPVPRPLSNGHRPPWGSLLLEAVLAARNNSGWVIEAGNSDRYLFVAIINCAYGTTTVGAKSPLRLAG